MIAIAQAATWIPLNPAPPAKYIDSAQDLDTGQRQSLHAILNDLRHQATSIVNTIFGL